jgi:hypothetical protein
MATNMLPTTYPELALRRQFMKRIEAELKSKGSFTKRGLFNCFKCPVVKKELFAILQI